MNKPVRYVVLTAVLFAGCASATQTPAAASAARGYRLSEVDVRPILLGCAEAPVNLGDKAFVGVGVAFTLDEHGVPQNVVGSRNSIRSYTPKGEQIVKSCRYTPAILNGKAVAVRGMSRSVRISVAEALGKPKIAAPLPSESLEYPVR